MDLGLTPLNLSACGQLEFLEPDYNCFPALQLAFDAITTGGTLPAVMNSANEIAVEAFLTGKISFLQIAETVAKTMDIVVGGDENSLEDILEADTLARKEATRIIGC
jgi:1-deoxy-D-xylulose-5-phosphate reductoisomerase